MRYRTTTYAICLNDGYHWVWYDASKSPQRAYFENEETPHGWVDKFEGNRSKGFRTCRGYKTWKETKRHIKNLPHLSTISKYVWHPNSSIAIEYELINNRWVLVP